MGLAIKTKSLVATAATALAMMVPLVGQAGDGNGDGDRMESLESRLLALEDELKETRSALEHSEQMRQQGVPPADVEAGSGLDAFLSGLEVGGFVEASYLWNFNNPESNTGSDPVTGFSGNAPQPLWQFNNNHNTFSLDAVKLELGKAADEAGSAGFQIDLLMGADNSILCGDPTITITDAAGDDVSPGDINYSSNADTNVCVQEAYVAYNWNDIVFQLGKWETLLGYELIDAPYNNHITHGMLFTWAIPLVHNGLLASGSFNENVGWAIGVTNGFNNITDTGDNKGVIGQLSYEEGPFFASVSGFVGSEEYRTVGVNSPPLTTTYIGQNDQQVWIGDIVMTYDPTDDLHLWLNGDYGKLHRDSGTVEGPFGPSTLEDPFWWGWAGGFKYNINERVSFAARGEYMEDHGGSRFSSALQGPASWSRVVTGTATLAYSLTSNLVARVEYRHDHLSPQSDRPYPHVNDGYCLDGGCQANLDVGIFEVYYQFD